MQSIYQTGSQGEQYNVPGLALLLADRNRRNDEAFNQIGEVAGGLTAAGIGAVQGAKNPSAFGEGTSSGFAALKGGLMNFRNATTGEGTNFKQFAALGKTADSLRDTMKMGTPTVEGQQPKVMGYTDDEWKHAGTDRKIEALKGFQQEMQVKATMLGYDKAMLDFQQAAKAAQAQQSFAAGLQKRGVNFGMDAMQAGQGPLRAPAMNPQEYADLAIQSGYDPLQASQMGENFSRMAALGAKADGKQYGPVEFSDVPGIPGAKVVTRDGYTSVVQAPQAGTPRAVRDPYAEIEFRELSNQESQLQKDLAAARAAKQFDKASQIYGDLNRLRKRMERLRGNSASIPTSTPASSGSASSRYTIVEE